MAVSAPQTTASESPDEHRQGNSRTDMGASEKKWCASKKTQTSLSLLMSSAAKDVREVLNKIGDGFSSDGAAEKSCTLPPSRQHDILRQLEKMLEVMGGVLTEPSPPLGNIRQFCRLVISLSYSDVLPGFVRLIMAHEGALVRLPLRALHRLFIATGEGMRINVGKEAHPVVFEMLWSLVAIAFNHASGGVPVVNDLIVLLFDCSVLMDIEQNNPGAITSSTTVEAMPSCIARVSWAMEQHRRQSGHAVQGSPPRPCNLPIPNRGTAEVLHHWLLRLLQRMLARRCSSVLSQEGVVADLHRLVEGRLRMSTQQPRRGSTGTAGPLSHGAAAKTARLFLRLLHDSSLGMGLRGRFIAPHWAEWTVHQLTTRHSPLPDRLRAFLAWSLFAQPQTGAVGMALPRLLSRATATPTVTPGSVRTGDHHAAEESPLRAVSSESSAATPSAPFGTFGTTLLRCLPAGVSLTTDPHLQAWWADVALAGWSMEFGDAPFALPTALHEAGLDGRSSAAEWAARAPWTALIRRAVLSYAAWLPVVAGQAIILHEEMSSPLDSSARLDALGGADSASGGEWRLKRHRSGETAGGDAVSPPPPKRARTSADGSPDTVLSGASPTASPSVSAPDPAILQSLTRMRLPDGTPGKVLAIFRRWFRDVLFANASGTGYGSTGESETQASRTQSVSLSLGAPSQPRFSPSADSTSGLGPATRAAMDDLANARMTGSLKAATDVSRKPRQMEALRALLLAVRVLLPLPSAAVFSPGPAQNRPASSENRQAWNTFRSRIILRALAVVEDAIGALVDGENPVQQEGHLLPLGQLALELGLRLIHSAPQSLVSRLSTVLCQLWDSAEEIWKLPGAMPTRESCRDARPFHPPGIALRVHCPQSPDDGAGLRDTGRPIPPVGVLTAAVDGEPPSTMPLDQPTRRLRMEENPALDRAWAVAAQRRAELLQRVHNSLTRGGTDEALSVAWSALDAAELPAGVSVLSLAEKTVLLAVSWLPKALRSTESATGERSWFEDSPPNEPPSARTGRMIHDAESILVQVGNAALRDSRPESSGDVSSPVAIHQVIRVWSQATQQQDSPPLAAWALLLTPIVMHRVLLAVGDALLEGFRREMDRKAGGTIETSLRQFHSAASELLFNAADRFGGVLSKGSRPDDPVIQATIARAMGQLSTVIAHHGDLWCAAATLEQGRSALLDRIRTPHPSRQRRARPDSDGEKKATEGSSNENDWSFMMGSRQRSRISLSQSSRAAFHRTRDSGLARSAAHQEEGLPDLVAALEEMDDDDDQIGQQEDSRAGQVDRSDEESAGAPAPQRGAPHDANDEDTFSSGAMGPLASVAGEQFSLQDLALLSGSATEAVLLWLGRVDDERAAHTAEAALRGESSAEGKAHGPLVGAARKALLTLEAVSASAPFQRLPPAYRTVAIALAALRVIKGTTDVASSADEEDDHVDEQSGHPGEVNDLTNQHKCNVMPLRPAEVCCRVTDGQNGDSEGGLPNGTGSTKRSSGPSAYWWRTAHAVGYAQAHAHWVGRAVSLEGGWVRSTPLIASSESMLLRGKDATTTDTCAFANLDSLVRSPVAEAALVRIVEQVRVAAAMDSDLSNVLQSGRTGQRAGAERDTRKNWFGREAAANVQLAAVEAWTTLTRTCIAQGVYLRQRRAAGSSHRTWRASSQGGPSSGRHRGSGATSRPLSQDSDEDGGAGGGGGGGEGDTTNPSSFCAAMWGDAESPTVASSTELQELCVPHNAMECGVSKTGDDNPTDDSFAGRFLACPWPLVAAQDSRVRGAAVEATQVCISYIAQQAWNHAMRLEGVAVDAVLDAAIQDMQSASSERSSAAEAGITRLPRSSMRDDGAKGPAVPASHQKKASTSSSAQRTITGTRRQLSLYGESDVPASSGAGGFRPQTGSRRSIGHDGGSVDLLWDAQEFLRGSEALRTMRSLHFWIRQLWVEYYSVADGFSPPLCDVKHLSDLDWDCPDAVDVAVSSDKRHPLAQLVSLLFHVWLSAASLSGETAPPTQVRSSEREQSNRRKEALGQATQCVDEAVLAGSCSKGNCDALDTEDNQDDNDLSALFGGDDQRSGQEDALSRRKVGAAKPLEETLCELAMTELRICGLWGCGGLRAKMRPEDVQDTEAERKDDGQQPLGPTVRKQDTGGPHRSGSTSSRARPRRSQQSAIAAAVADTDPSLHTSSEVRAGLSLAGARLPLFTAVWTTFVRMWAAAQDGSVVRARVGAALRRMAGSAWYGHVPAKSSGDGCCVRYVLSTLRAELWPRTAAVLLRATDPGLLIAFWDEVAEASKPLASLRSALQKAVSSVVPCLLLRRSDGKDVLGLLGFLLLADVGHGNDDKKEVHEQEQQAMADDNHDEQEMLPKKGKTAKKRHRRLKHRHRSQRSTEDGEASLSDSSGSENGNSLGMDDDESDDNNGGDGAVLTSGGRTPSRTNWDPLRSWASATSDADAEANGTTSAVFSPHVHDGDGVPRDESQWQSFASQYKEYRHSELLSFAQALLRHTAGGRAPLVVAMGALLRGTGGFERTCRGWRTVEEVMQEKRPDAVTHQYFPSLLQHLVIDLGMMEDECPVEELRALQVLAALMVGDDRACPVRTNLSVSKLRSELGFGTSARSGGENEDDDVSSSSSVSASQASRPKRTSPRLARSRGKKKRGGGVGREDMRSFLQPSDAMAHSNVTTPSATPLASQRKGPAHFSDDCGSVSSADRQQFRQALSQLSCEAPVMDPSLRMRFGADGLAMETGKIKVADALLVAFRLMIQTNFLSLHTTHFSATVSAMGMRTEHKVAALRSLRHLLRWMDPDAAESIMPPVRSLVQTALGDAALVPEACRLASQTARLLPAHSLAAHLSPLFVLLLPVVADENHRSRHLGGNRQPKSSQRRYDRTRATHGGEPHGESCSHPPGSTSSRGSSRRRDSWLDSRAMGAEPPPLLLFPTRPFHFAGGALSPMFPPQGLCLQPMPRGGVDGRQESSAEHGNRAPPRPVLLAGPRQDLVVPAAIRASVPLERSLGSGVVWLGLGPERLMSPSDVAVEVLRLVLVELRSATRSGMQDASLLPSLSRLSPIRRALGNDLEGVTKLQQLQERLVYVIGMLSHNSEGVVALALDEVKAILQSDSATLHEMMHHAGGFEASELVVKLLQSLLAVARRATSVEVREKCATCLGELGALDPARVGSLQVAESVHEPQPAVDVAVILIQEHFVRVLRAASDSTAQSIASVSVQDMLQFLRSWEEGQLMDAPEESQRGPATSSRGKRGGSKSGRRGGAHSGGGHSVPISFARRQSPTSADTPMPTSLRKKFPQEIAETIAPYWTTAFRRAVSACPHPVRNGGAAQRADSFEPSQQESAAADQTSVPERPAVVNVWASFVSEEAQEYIPLYCCVRESRQQSQYAAWLSTWAQYMVQQLLRTTPDHPWAGLWRAVEPFLKYDLQAVQFLLPYLVRIVMQCCPRYVGEEVFLEMIAVLVVAHDDSATAAGARRGGRESGDRLVEPTAMGSPSTPRLPATHGLVGRGESNGGGGGGGVIGHPSRATRQHATQTIFSLLDTFATWMATTKGQWPVGLEGDAPERPDAAERTPSDARQGGSEYAQEEDKGRAVSQPRGTAWLVEQIPKDVLANAAYSTHASARALYYLENYIRLAHGDDFGSLFNCTPTLVHSAPLERSPSSTSSASSSKPSRNTMRKLIAQRASEEGRIGGLLAEYVPYSREDLAFLQLIAAQLDEPDTLPGVSACRSRWLAGEEETMAIKQCDQRRRNERERTIDSLREGDRARTTDTAESAEEGPDTVLLSLREQLLDAEHDARWSDAVVLYEQALRHQEVLSSSPDAPLQAPHGSEWTRSGFTLADLHSGVLRCLQYAGSPTTALHRAVGVLVRQPSLAASVRPWAVQSAWQVCEWDALRSLLGKNDSESATGRQEENGSLPFGSNGSTESQARASGMGGEEVITRASARATVEGSFAVSLGRIFLALREFAEAHSAMKSSFSLGQIGASGHRVREEGLSSSQLPVPSSWMSPSSRRLGGPTGLSAGSQRLASGSGGSPVDWSGMVHLGQWTDVPVSALVGSAVNEGPNMVSDTNWVLHASLVGAIGSILHRGGRSGQLRGGEPASDEGPMPALLRTAWPPPRSVAPHALCELPTVAAWRRVAGVESRNPLGFPGGRSAVWERSLCDIFHRSLVNPAEQRDEDEQRRRGSLLSSGSSPRLWEASAQSSIDAALARPRQSLLSALEDARLDVLHALAAASRESYQRAYPYLIRLQALRELEHGVELLGVADEAERTALLREQRWAHRLELTQPSLTAREPLLSVRRTLFRMLDLPTHEAAAWLEVARLAGGVGQVDAAKSALAHADTLGSREARLASAKLLYQQGDTERAVQVLEPVERPLPSLKAVLRSLPPRERRTEVERLLWATVWRTEAGHSNSDVAERFRVIHEASSRDTSRRHDEAYFFLGQYCDRQLKRIMSRLRQQGTGSSLCAKRDYFLFLVVKNYVASLSSGEHKHLFQSLPRVLTLFFDYGAAVAEQHADGRSRERDMAAQPGGRPDPYALATEETLVELEKYIGRLQDKMAGYLWMAVLPQLASRICHRHERVVNRLLNVLKSILFSYPKHAMWTLLGLTRSQVELRRNRAKGIVNSLKAINDEIQNRLSVAEVLYKDLTNLAMTIADKKVTFQPTNRKKTLVEAELLIPTQDALTVHLPDATTGLSTDVASSGFLNENNPVHLTDIDRTVTVYQSKERPKKVTFFGSDGKEYPFLCKQEDRGDFRKDSRVMEYCSMVNRLLQQDDEARRRKLRVRTFAVTCLTERCGLLEWMSNTASFRSQIDRVYDAYGFDSPMKKTREVAKELQTLQENFLHSPDVAVENYRACLLPIFPRLFHHWFELVFADVTAWLESRLAFTRSAALWSMVGHIIGLGDRHGENLLIDMKTGGCNHVDFDCIFDKGLSLRTPERVPFRVTPNLVEGMGITGYEGVFRRTAEVSLRVLRQNRDMVLSVLESFIYDPSVEWGRHPSSSSSAVAGRSAPHRSAIPPSQLDVGFPATVIGGEKPDVDGMELVQRIFNRLGGSYNLPLPANERANRHARDSSADGLVSVSVPAQVQRLINEATSDYNLARMYIGWMPFL